MGEHVLPVVVPHLQLQLGGGDLAKREGICLGLTEILTCATSTQIEAYVGMLVSALRQALCDEARQVRQQAALAFQTMMKSIGNRAVDHLVPSLLHQIEEDWEELDGEEVSTSMAVLGLKEIVSQRPRELLEYLLPQLLATPMTSFSAKILGHIAPACGSQLNFQFHIIVPDIIPELCDSASDPTLHADLRSCASAVMAAVSSSGVNYLIEELVEHIEDDDPVARKWGCWLLEQFIRYSEADYEEFICIFLKYLLSLCADKDREVLVAVNEALSALVSTVPVETMSQHLEFIISYIRSTASDARHRSHQTIRIFSILIVNYNQLCPAS